MNLSEITSALRAFILQRPGFEPADYAGAPGAYRADYRKCLRDRDDALFLLARALWHYLAGSSADAVGVRRQARLLFGRRIASRWFA